MEQCNTSKKPKRGRPRKKESEVSSVSVGFRVTKDERKDLVDFANSKGLDISGWLRKLVHDDMKHKRNPA